MNVLKTLMTVSIIAQTLKEGIIVLVTMAMLVLEATVQVCIINFIVVTTYSNQISMNVLKVLMTVIIIAPTLKEALNVLVDMAMN